MDGLILLDIGDLVPLGDLWGSAIGFVVIFVGIVGAIGIGSRNMAIGSMGAYLTFVHFASESGIDLLESLLYVTLVLVIIGSAFKLWRLEGFETGS